jgi:hypothetical protein
MGLLSKLRAWIGGESGSTTEEGADGREEGDGGDTEKPSDADDPAADEPTGLDPNAATETRTAATDDAVDALRDVRRSQATASANEREDEAADEPDGPDAGGDRDAP